MRLDFSQFHDQMHMPFTRHCRGQYPRGWRAGFHHLRLSWMYRYRDALRSPLHTLWLCRRGKHDVEVWYGRSESDTVTVRPRCGFCTYEREPTEAERAEMPPFIAARHIETTED